ncbi:hypothetical protein JCM10908_007389 [Rhodotorula pacifica]|uniref:uncharacterized protein n=1 Tax=Rhodotorula pacifica TaxID=1495444 RepID=UPI003175F913
MPREARPITSLLSTPAPLAEAQPASPRRPPPHKRHQTSAHSSTTTTSTLHRAQAPASRLNVQTDRDIHEGTTDEQAAIKRARPTKPPAKLQPISALFAPPSGPPRSETSSNRLSKPTNGNEAPAKQPGGSPARARTKRVLASGNEVGEWEKEAQRMRRAVGTQQPQRRRLERVEMEMDQDAQQEEEEEKEDEGIVQEGGEEGAVMQGTAQSATSKPPLRPMTRLHQPPPPNRSKPPDLDPHPGRPLQSKKKKEEELLPAEATAAKGKVARYDLSSLAPLAARPVGPRKKQRLDEEEGSAALASGPIPVKVKVKKEEPLSRLSRVLVAPSTPTPAENEKEKKERKPALALSAFRPPAPAVTSTAIAGGEEGPVGGRPEGDDEEMEMMEEEWSPRKKRGGYLASGIAARASSLLSGIRTSHTLWVHEFSRRLAQIAPFATSSVAALAKELQPDLRFKVLEVLTFAEGGGSEGNDAAAEADSFVVRDRRRERRSTLAMCRLLRDAPAPSSAAASAPSANQDGLEPPPPPTRETQGLVLFSLHDQLGLATSTTGGSVVPLPSPTKNRHPGRGGGVVKPVIPAVPPDLRLIRPGAEVWVWEPFHQIGLVDPRAEGVVFDEESGLGIGQAGEGEEEVLEGVEGVAVRWENGHAVAGGRSAGDGSTEAVAKKGLVCGRFAVLA